MESSTVTIKGQIVIPSKIRKKYNIHKGTVIHFNDVNNEIKIIPVTEKLIEKNAGLLKTNRSLIKTLFKDKKKEREL